jgi:hypothetical protein
MSTFVRLKHFQHAAQRLNALIHKEEAATPWMNMRVWSLFTRQWLCYQWAVQTLVKEWMGVPAFKGEREAEALCAR